MMWKQMGYDDIPYYDKNGKKKKKKKPRNPAGFNELGKHRESIPSSPGLSENPKKDSNK